MLLNLKDLLERLPPAQLLRVHKSYLVSLAKIKAVDGSLILFQDGKAIVPSGNAYRHSFFGVLQRYVVSGKIRPPNDASCTSATLAAVRRWSWLMTGWYNNR